MQKKNRLGFLTTRLIYTTQNKICSGYKYACIFPIRGKIESNIYLEQPFYLPTKTRKYGGSVYLVQSLLEELHVIDIFSGLITIAFSGC